MSQAAYYLGQLVEASLKEIILNIDCRGRDKKLFLIAQSDVKYYLGMEWRIENFTDNIFYKKFEEYMIEEGMNVKVFMDQYFSKWYKKWQQRVQIVLGDNVPNVDGMLMTKMFRVNPRIISFSKLTMFRFPVIESLIKHGEIACLNLIGDTIIKSTLAECKEPPNTPEKEVQLLNKILAKVRMMSKTDIPIVFISVKGNYFTGTSNRPFFFGNT